MGQAVNQPRGHPGTYRIARVETLPGSFTLGPNGISLMTDEGRPVVVAVQVRNLCSHIRIEKSSTCVFAIDHPGPHADGQGHIWDDAGSRAVW